ncbi:hypothetical protein EV182_005904, partial [Spiromyces aspiralis]
MSASTAPSSTAGSVHSILIAPGEDLCSFFNAREFLKYKRPGMCIRVGYTDKDSPFVKELERMGAEMVQFDLDDMSSMQRMYEGMTCAAISPPTFCSNYSKSTKIIEAALKAKDLKRVAMMSLLHADKLRDLDRLRPICDMEKMFERGMEKWDGACIMRLSAALESFYTMCRMIQENREMPWPTRDQKVAPVSYREVAKVVRCMLMKEKHEGDIEVISDDDSDSEAESPVITVSLADEAARPRHCLKCNFTGAREYSGEELARECSRALSTEIHLKAMSPKEYAECLKKTGELADQYVKTTEQIAEAIHKGLWQG